MAAPPQTVIPAASAPQPGVLLARGVCRALLARGLAPVTELVLPTGLRMDVCALAGDGSIWCVEVKSSRADFLSDRKWEGYWAFCDRLLFAVPEGFPDALLPLEAGLMRADGHGAELLREGVERRLAAARRRAMMQRVARIAAERLARLTDPVA